MVFIPRACVHHAGANATAARHTRHKVGEHAVRETPVEAFFRLALASARLLYETPAPDNVSQRERVCVSRVT
jgi:hypothetical protein